MTQDTMVRSLGRRVIAAQQRATKAAFFIPGFASATWASFVPFAKSRLHADDASLGLALFCLGAGSLLQCL